MVPKLAEEKRVMLAESIIWKSLDADTKKFSVVMLSDWQQKDRLAISLNDIVCLCFVCCAVFIGKPCYQISNVINIYYYY
jgi:hypothetical protein